MSRVKIEGNASGTGTFTISAPNSNTDRNLTLPDGAGEILLSDGDGSNLTGISSYSDADALTLFNASGSAPVYACRAWVQFNGTGTPSINGSGNVSSITDNGTGLYRVNFTTAMPDTNYAVSGIAARPNTNSDMNINLPRNGTYTTSAVQVYTHSNANGTSLDAYRIGVQIYR